MCRHTLCLFFAQPLLHHQERLMSYLQLMLVCHPQVKFVIAQGVTVVYLLCMYSLFVAAVSSDKNAIASASSLSTSSPLPEGEHFMTL